MNGVDQRNTSDKRMDHEQEAAHVHGRILRGMTPAQKYAQLITLRETA